MLKNRKITNIKEIDKKLKKYKIYPIPKEGWINTLRRMLNMSMAQLGKKLGLSSQGVYALEKREQEGSITLNRIKEAADALDMDFFYVLLPRTSLEAFVEKKARKKAKEIVRRSYQNMLLEDQAPSRWEVREQEDDMTKHLKDNLIGTLWEA